MTRAFHGSLIAGAALVLACSTQACDGAPTSIPAEAVVLYRTETPQFHLELKSTAATSSSASDHHLTLDARTPWKLADEFPAQLAVRGPGDDSNALIQLDRSEATRADEAGLEFTWREPDMPDGSGVRRGRLSFAICRGPVCERKDFDFEIDGAAARVRPAEGH